MKKIALIGDYDRTFTPHSVTDDALAHSAAALNLDLTGHWFPTPTIDRELLSDPSPFSAIWIVPGSPYKDMLAVLRAIRFAREHAIPLLGTCGGFQHLVLEFARNVAGLADAAHAESDPEASRIVLMRLACSLVGKTLPINVVPGTLASAAYASPRVDEQFYCNFGLNPEYIPALTAAGLKISGTDDSGEVRIMELPGHPFFVGTLFVPQFLSTPEHPHPIISAFARAAVASSPAPAAV